METPVVHVSIWLCSKQLLKLLVCSLAMQVVLSELNFIHDPGIRYD